MDILTLNGVDIKVTGNYTLIPELHGVIIETVDEIKNFTGKDGRLVRVDADIPKEFTGEIEYKNYIIMSVAALDKWMNK